MNKHDILEKVKKILARADADKNDNENERATAMRQANALLAKYGLSVADAEEHEKQTMMGDRIFADVDRPERAKYVNYIYGSLAKLYNLDCVLDMEESKYGRYTFVGREVNIQNLKMMFEYLYNSIKREAHKMYESERDVAIEYGDPIPNRKSWVTSFSVGAALGVHTQVEEILKQQAQGNIDGEQISKDKALILVNDRKSESTQNALMIRKRFGAVQTRSSRPTVSRQDAFSQGKEYGNNVSLNNQIGGNGPAGYLE